MSPTLRVSFFVSDSSIPPVCKRFIVSSTISLGVGICACVSDSVAVCGCLRVLEI